MSTTDGGPAFPSHGSMGEVAHEGMSLRDYLAAKAMQGWVSSESMRYNDENVDHAAKFSYAMADAMLKARGESKESGDEA